MPSPLPSTQALDDARQRLAAGTARADVLAQLLRRFEGALLDAIENGRVFRQLVADLVEAFEVEARATGLEDATVTADRLARMVQGARQPFDVEAQAIAEAAGRPSGAV